MNVEFTVGVSAVTGGGSVVPKAVSVTSVAAVVP